MSKTDSNTETPKISRWQWNADRPETRVRKADPVSYLLNRLWLRIHISWLGERFSVGVISITGVALVFRLLAIPLSLLRINPYAQADATKFAAHATRIANGFLNGQVLVGVLYHDRGTGFVASVLGGGGSSIDIDRYWSLLLSLFWLLPGPSTYYAHIVMALLGTLAAYNVYVLGRYYRSSAVGVLAALPVAVYPSFVLIHATLLREVVILAGITSVVCLLVCSPQWLPRWGSTLLAVVILISIVPLRPENVPLYGLVITVAVFVGVLENLTLNWKLNTAITGIAVVTAGFTSISLLRRGLDQLRRIHQHRARGRTAYLGSVDLNTVTEAIAIGPISALYFLFSPFPWMVHTPADAIVAVEALGNVMLAVAALWGIKYAFRRSPPLTVSLLVGFLAASFLYGIVDPNVGIAVRHRQMFIWIVYLIGAIGLVNWSESEIAENVLREKLSLTSSTN